MSLHHAIALQQRVTAGASLDAVLDEIARITGARSVTFERKGKTRNATTGKSIEVESGGHSFVLTVDCDEIDAELLRLLAGFALSATLQRRENDYLKLLQEIAVAANEAASVEEAIRRSLARICEA